MSHFQLKTPVVMIIFNRPETTEKVFAAIRQVRPPQLFVIADGPRNDRPGEAEKCAAARAIINRVDWPCEVLANYSNINLGCRQRVYRGLNWVFEKVESAIILEDDCVPHPSFFEFCQELLEKYRHEPRITTISGDNFQFGNNPIEESYYFSRYPHCWGWATWRRAWQNYDDKMSLWPQLRNSNWLPNLLPNAEAVRYWSRIFENNYQGFNSWAYAWTFICWSRNGLTILPEVNLVSNIGFNETATHTSNPSRFAKMATEAISFPLKHPTSIIANIRADNFTEKTVFSGSNSLPKEAIATWKQQFSEERSIFPARLPAQKEAPTQQLIQQANQALKDNQNETAFKLLNQAKSLKQPAEGLDYLRAIYFMRANQLEAAIQALNEELRYFPNNETAKNLLKEILEQTTQNTGIIEDPEFQELLQIVRPHTMLSEARLYSLFSLVKRICRENIAGNIVECGVAGGGSTALMAVIVKRYSKQPRWLYAFDSFEGMPPPTERDKHEGIAADDTGWGTGTCAAPEANVRQLCSQLGVADIVKTVKGYFQETLPKMRSWVGMISLLHIDGDWYESTQTILENFYDKVGNNCLIQIDDYGYWEGCRQAVTEFEHQRQIKFNFNRIDDTGVWCSCPNKFPINPVIEPTLINEFKQDDPVVYGIESQMSLNERFQLYYALRKLLPGTTSPVRFIEIGSYAGSSLFLTCKALKRRATQLQGFAVEPGGKQQFYQVLKEFTGEVQHLRMLSDRAAPPVKNFFEQDGNFPIFIFIDGDHNYEGVRQDLLNYWPLLAPGGIMMFHDYLPPLNDENKEAIFFHHGGKETGIRKACEELMSSYGGEAVDIPLLYPTDPTQTQAHLPIIPGVFSTIRAYRKPAKEIKKSAFLESDCVII
jgi:predicted O-methyltransferase YrrM